MRFHFENALMALRSCTAHFRGNVAAERLALVLILPL